VNLSDNPDPRGPCGAKIAQPDLGSGASIAIGSSSIVGFQGVLRPTEPTAEAFLDANLADVREGCPPWQSTTNTGSTQTVTLLDVVPDQPVPDGVDQQLAVVLKVEDSGQTAYAGVIALRSGDVLSELAYFGPAPVDARTVAELVVLLGARLAG
jgi:hypothetical protein